RGATADPARGTGGERQGGEGCQQATAGGHDAILRTVGGNLTKISPGAAHLFKPAEASSPIEVGNILFQAA
ncbi:MAG: hypothetical protein ABIH17_11755, partial [Pseudomonadota bacterium]